MHESYLSVFFEEMNLRFPKEWCILHSFDTLPKYSESDVDMAFSGDSINDLETLIIQVAKKTGWQLYQKLWYDVKSCNYYVLKQDNSDVYLALDFLIDNDGIARYGFKTKFLTHDCVFFNKLFPVPNPEVAFFYKLVKRIEKQRSLNEDIVYLKEQYSFSDSSKINVFLKTQFGEEGKALINKFIVGQESLTDSDLYFLKSRRKEYKFNFLSNIKYFYWEIRRRFNRVFFPCGVKIIVPGLHTDDLVHFIDLLESKVNILFRFVNLNKHNSLKQNFVGMAGSTLVICPQNGFNGYNAIKYSWGSSQSLSKEKLMGLENNVEGLVNLYYDLIIKSLLVILSKSDRIL